MFTATITEKKFENGVLSVSVTYTDGENSFTETVRNIPDVDSAISFRLAELEKIATANIQEGTFTPAQKEETEKEIFQKKVHLLNALLNHARLGILDETDTSITDLRAELKKTYKPAFLVIL